MTRKEKSEIKKRLEEFNSDDFIFMPKKVNCPKHRDREVKFYSDIARKFYCHLCAKDFAGHTPIVLEDMQRDL